MAVADYTSATDLKAVDHLGLIREDVMDKIWDISKVPLPFTDLVGKDTAKNDYTEWTEDKLGDPALGGFVVDGADSDQNDSALGSRLGNHCGTLTKEVQVTTRANASDTIGRGNELAYQLRMRQQELRRNVEANALNINGSVASDANNGTAGVPAGLGAMMTQHDTGSGATGGGFSAGAWTAITPGTRAPLTETMVRDACQAAWEGGADPSQLMSVPGVIRQLSEYMFTSSSRIATLTKESPDGSAKAVGSVNVFITDYGVTLTFLPNRLQQSYADVSTTNEAAAVFIFDPSYARLSYLSGYQTFELAKSGLSEKRLMAVDFTAKLMNRDSGRVLLDIDPTAPVTQA